MREIKEPNIEFEIPLKKNKDGHYMPFPNHIGGKNSLRKMHANKVDDAYVYLIQMKEMNIYKIGVTTRPQKRFRDIASSIPFDLKLLALNKIKNPYVFEQELIDRYSENLIRNEWFSFDIETVKDIMVELHNRQVDECR